MAFDKVIFMCDGHIVYQGAPELVPDHFAKGNIIFPKFKNPADIAMQVLSVNYPKTALDNQKVDALVKLYDKELKQKDLDLSNVF